MKTKHKMITLLLLCCLFIGCQAKVSRVKIAVIVKSTTSQFFQSMLAGVVAASSEYNIDYIFQGPSKEEDYETQIQQVYQIIQNGYHGLVLSAIDYEALVEPVETAIAKGLKVIVVDSDIHSDLVHVRIGTDNYQAGQMAAEAMLDQSKGDLHVGIVNFSMNTKNGQDREDGFKETLGEHERVKSIQIINVDSDILSATEATKDLLKSDQKMNAIVTFNEWTTLGVGYAIKELDLKERVCVVAFDNHPISVEMLETGEVNALIVQSPFSMGYLGVEHAYQLITNKKVNTSEIATKTVTITKENMFDQENQKIVFPFR